MIPLPGTFIDPILPCIHECIMLEIDRSKLQSGS